MGKLSFHHLLDAHQIKISDVEKIIRLADKYRKNGHKKNLKKGDGKGLILGTLFFEPSTRTRFSFESAMLRIGGQTITLEYGEASSVKKGETLADMGRVISGYCDLIVIRHPKIGSAKEFVSNAKVPVINAGDGMNQHPTQGLVDLYTIFSEKKRLNNLKVGILGDLKHGRAVHSFINLLSQYPNNSFTLISHPSLALASKDKEELENNGVKIIETESLESLPDLDVLYVTRVQRERFNNEEEYEKVSKLYLLNKNSLSQFQRSSIIMHPLPRVGEIDSEVDSMPQAKYFEQADNGVYVRMALLALMKK